MTQTPHKFKVDDRINVKGEPDVWCDVLYVGQTKYFVQFADGKEDCILIETTDKYQEVKGGT